jgi:tetratricopeptide (TPR) repeat protein
MHYQLRNYTEAETLYQRALDIRTRYYSRQSDRVAQTLHNLAFLARSQGAEERAERLLTECLAIREVSYRGWGGRAHAHQFPLARLSFAGGSLCALHSTLLPARPPPRLLPLFPQSLPTPPVQDIAGGVHPETQKTAQALASLLRTQGRKEDAARLQRTLDGWRRQQASDADSSWLRTSVAVALDRVDPAYRLHSRIIGPRGVHIKHIMQSSGAMQVRLGFAAPDEPATAAHAGRGAGPPEPPSPAERYLSGGDRALDALSDGLDGQRAHALLITASSEEALRRARQLCEEHLAQVRADYAKWSARHSAGAGTSRRRDPPAPASAPSRVPTATLADFIKPAKPKK